MLKTVLISLTIGYHYLEFVMSLIDYPRHATRTVVVMDGATIHRNEDARKYLRDRGISVYILTPSSSELNPIEKVWSLFKSELVRRQAHMNHEQLASLDFAKECEDHVREFCSKRDGSKFVYAVYESMWRVLALGQVV